MIVWSRGLGKLKLPMELKDANLRVAERFLALEGTIEPVCWKYRVELYPKDIRAFAKLLADKRTAQLLARERGLLLPLLGNLLIMVVKLPAKILWSWIRGQRHTVEA
jgi:hypothetical protein